MRSVAELARAARAAVELAAAAPAVREVEAFASASEVLLCRLNYTSHIPCNGVEEPKSTARSGLGLRVVFDSAAGPLIGFGSEPSDLGPDGAARALAKARRAAVADPGFVSLPRSDAPAMATAAVAALLPLDDTALVDAGWTVVNGAIRTFLTSTRLAALAGDDDAGLRRLGLIVGGDVTVLAERMALVSTAMPEARVDEAMRATAFVTAMVETRDAKGSGWSTAIHLADLGDEAGAEAARNAIAAIDGRRVPSGRYTVVLGPQPVAEIVDNLLVPACSAGRFFAGTTPFAGRLGRPVASPGLSIYDDGARPGAVASRRVTCEGLATGRTDLVRHGTLVGCLSSWYETQRLLRDPRLSDKLGATGAAAAAALVPRNGFRLGTDGGRDFATPPDVAASNIVVEGDDAASHDDLLARVGEGLYVGRIWYCYAINGLRAGDFTCTVVADSHIIRGGRLAAPLRPNTIRINDNIANILNSVIGVTRDVRSTVVWAADEVVYAPEIAVAGVRIDAIADFMEDLD